MTTHSTNGLAKSWHQSLNTIMLTAAIGIGSWCWHLLTNNSDRLIRVEDRQQMVLDEHVIFRSEFQRINDRLERLESNKSKP